MSFLKKIGPLRFFSSLFFLLLLFILIVEKPGQNPLKEEHQPLFFPRLNLESVTHAIIKLPGMEGGTLELRNAEEGWRIGENPADPQKVDDFLSVIYHLKKTALVSKNPEKYGLFGIDTDHAVHIRLFKHSKELVNFYVGDPAGSESQYVRTDDASNVFQASPRFPEFNFF